MVEDRDRFYPVTQTVFWTHSESVFYHGWTLAFPLDFHMLCGAVEGRLGHFLPRWLRRVV